jgi:hypothetical protein
MVGLLLENSGDVPAQQSDFFKALISSNLADGPPFSDA